MQLRRFTADSTPAALGAVRLALGDDAIILANRRVGDQVEIIATGQMDDVASMVESSVDGMSVALASKPEQGQQAHVAGSVSASHKQHMGPVLINADAVPDAAAANQSMSASMSAAALETIRRGEKAAESVPEIAEDTVSISDLSQSIDTADVEKISLTGVKPSLVMHGRDSGINGRPPERNETESSQKSNAVEPPTLESLAAALESQSQQLNQHFKSLEVNLWGSNAPNRSKHLQQLLSLGIGAELAVRLVERTSPDLSVDMALRQSFAMLKTSLPIAHDKTFTVPGVTVLYGPPGAGKTTALIKLATEHVRKFDNQSIVIICADTRRIGAFEELQAYGRLLGVPTVHAHDSTELASLTAAFTHKQLVLIDHTLPKEERALELPSSLMHPDNRESVRHLFALPAITQAATAESLIAKHCVDRRMHCVLTNLDTSARLGELLNAIIRHELPVAYWSDSASVQRPLQRADASVLIATAVAMRRRIEQSIDDQWLHRLVQPSNNLFEESLEAVAGSAQALQ
jgi:flagellar biosynthesis protein FlhF